MATCLLNFLILAWSIMWLSTANQNKAVAQELEQHMWTLRAGITSTLSKMIALPDKPNYRAFMKEEFLNSMHFHHVNGFLSLLTSLTEFHSWSEAEKVLFCCGKRFQNNQWIYLQKKPEWNATKAPRIYIQNSKTKSVNINLTLKYTNTIVIHNKQLPSHQTFKKHAIIMHI